VRWTNFYFRKK